MTATGNTDLKPVTPGEILGLMLLGGNYGHVTLDEIDYAVIDAARHNKMLMWRHPATGNLVGFMTYALIPFNMVPAFMSNSMTIGGNDFACNEGELWGLDFVAPIGGVRKMMREAQTLFARKYGDGIVCNWKRIGRHRPKLGYAVMRENS